MGAGSDSDATKPGLTASGGALVGRHDVLLVDLDGVAYLGDRPIDGAAQALGVARDAGVGVVFVTNNASRPPGEVATQLEAMGVAAHVSEVMTSAIAAAAALAGQLPAGAAVLVVGGPGVRDALTDAGLTPIDSADDRPAAVLQGFAPEVGWRALAEAALAINAGATWVATNTDLTLPSPRGPLPGNGSLVAALKAATGRQPRVIGKPAPALFSAALAAHPGDRPLVIGDRLDTDIAGARAAGLPSLLVLSGVSGARDLLGAGRHERPDYIGRDLRALLTDHPGASVTDGVATSGGATATLVDGGVRVSSSDLAPTADGLDGLRALTALAWANEKVDSVRQVYDDALKKLSLE
jgi:glycerol 3-phosphatase-2